MHDAAVVQVTPVSSLNCAPGGTGADWMRHLAPPHRSTRGFPAELPTAVQLSAAGHTTANKVLDEDPVGLGVGWMCQLLPFHRSASVSCAPDLTKNCPTLVQAELVGHDTPLSALVAARGGFGVDWTVHLPPLRRSASVTPSPDSRTCKPTAIHADVAGQETALSAPFPARGFGVGVVAHPDPGACGERARAPVVTGPANAKRPAIKRVAPGTSKKRRKVLPPPERARRAPRSLGR